MSVLLAFAVVMLQFSAVDDIFKYECDYPKCKEILLEMNNQADSGSEKAEILWRLSRVSLMLGESAVDIESKRLHFKEGKSYAERGIKEDPQNINCHMWHCANTGRECQTHSLMEQAAAVPSMTRNLTEILDKIGAVDCSEAWQALSEMYWHHPFKSDEAAVNYARKAAYCIPSDELRLSTYIYLAELLYERNWSSARRASEAKANISRFKAGSKSNIDRYAYFDGASLPLPWTGSTIGAVSDREEARLILKYAEDKYSRCNRLSPVDKEDYKKLQKILSRK